MKPRSRGSLGILLVVGGLAIFLIAMFTGLNEYPEGSFPGWLSVVQALGGVLVLVGVAVTIASSFGRGKAT
jgi:peptidoglycan/LPS O-acetylase OafA/YrhL